MLGIVVHDCVYYCADCGMPVDGDMCETTTHPCHTKVTTHFFCNSCAEARNREQRLGPPYPAENNGTD